MAVTSLDGRAFEKFVAAGTYFLRKYRTVLNDLNVFPVPDGDTGSNMYLTARAALSSARRASAEDGRISIVAEAAAKGSLLGARGNSGVILSQMLRGFAHTVRHRDTIDTFQLAMGMRDAVATARAALTKPVEGTILSVATAAADEAYRLAVRESDFYRLTAAAVHAANEALERTPDQLPALKEAGVVDSGGAGFCYFLEGALRFLPDATVRATAFPRRPIRQNVFTRQQTVGEHHFCTEFVVEHATIEVRALREALEPLGESLIVAGAPPTIKVHIHTGDPERVKRLAGHHGTLTRVKVEDMAEQHHVLVVEKSTAPFAIAAVVPGTGFAQIARELGADVTIPVPDGANPSVRELLVGVNATLADRVVLLPNDPNVALAAREVAALTEKTVVVLPTRDVLAGFAVQLAFAGAAAPPDIPQAVEVIAGVRSASVFYAGKDAVVGGVPVKKHQPAAKIGEKIVTGRDLVDTVVAASEALGANDGGLVTLYYGGKQTERDAQRVAAIVGERFAEVDVEYYFGGASTVEYWISVER